jgi:predicted amidophosphoribosyltransferase
MSSVVLKNLTQIDDLTRADHWYLEATDSCHFFGEYTAQKGYSHSPCNQLIVNFKHDPQKRVTSPYAFRYKVQAIADVSRALASVFRPEHISSPTFVPVPPSKAKNDPAYDDRCVQTLRQMANYTSSPIDVRELVIQTASTDASHGSDNRLGPSDLIPIYAIDEGLAFPSPTSVVIFDDVLTTGAHFKAMQHVLSHRFPGVPIYGIFIARRKPENPFETA